MLHFFHVSGDGQEAMPGQTLPRPLQVGVANGQWPVAGAQVSFDITAGNGTLTAGNVTDLPLIVKTDATGIAECSWQLDATTQSQQVEATLIDAPNSPIRFNANLSQASAVAYDPSNCADLAQAGVRTVQQAIDELCRRAPEKEPGIGIQRIRSMADDDAVLNDVIVPVSRLAAGLIIECDARLSNESAGGVPSEPPSEFDPSTVPAKPTCVVTLDLPYPLGDEQRRLWDLSGVVGFQPLIVASTLLIRENRIEWSPTAAAKLWLQDRLFPVLKNMQIDRILAHPTIKGNFIWQGDLRGDPSIYVDGEAFGRPSSARRVDLRLPSGDGRRGGDFEMWFWLAPGGLLAPDIDVTPTSLAFGNVSVGQNPTQSLTVRNTGSAELSITRTGITSNRPWFSVVSPTGPFSVAPNAQQTVTVRFSPTSESGTPVTGTLSIASNDPDEPTVRIPMQGISPIL